MLGTALDSKIQLSTKAESFMRGTGEERGELNTHKKQSNTVDNDKEKERVTSGALMKREAVAI